MNGSILKNKLKQKGMSVETLAEKCGVARSTMYRKISMEISTTLAEASKIKTILGLTEEEANSIFFG